MNKQSISVRNTELNSDFQSAMIVSGMLTQSQMDEIKNLSDIGTRVWTIIIIGKGAQI